MGNLQTWFIAARPKTLFAAVAPVLMGTAMALGDGLFHFPSACLALAGALAIQILTNLANDYFDFKKGADKNRIGPTRVMQAGLVSAGEMKAVMGIFVAVTVIISFFLVQRAGMPIVIIAVASLISAFIYTAGPYPLAYLGLGELFVLVFFGPVAVAGTYYVQGLEMNPAVILAGLSCGFLSVAILAVNNLRDIDGDAKAGKRTLAVRFGRSFATTEYVCAVLLAVMTPVGVYALTKDHPVSLLSVVTVFSLVGAIRTVFTKTDGPSLNKVLAQTGRALFIFSLLFSLGWLL